MGYIVWAQNEHGDYVVQKGDDVYTRDGEVWTFVQVTRGTEYNGTAKVLVEHKTELNWHGNGPLQREFYERVFGLTVVPAPDTMSEEDDYVSCPYKGWTDEEWAEQYDEMLNDVYGLVNVAGMEYDTGRALRELDPIAYRVGLSEYRSSTEEECEYQHEH